MSGSTMPTCSRHSQADYVARRTKFTARREKSITANSLTEGQIYIQEMGNAFRENRKA